MAKKQQYEVRFPTIQEFQQYLRDLKTENYMDFCGTGNCPIAQWVEDTLGLPASYRVYVDGISMTLYNRWHQLVMRVEAATGWPEKFVAAVDEYTYSKYGDWETWEELTPAETLRILNSVI